MFLIGPVRVCLFREGATQRLLDAAAMSDDEWPGKWTRLRDWLIWRLVYAGNGKHPTHAPYAPAACIVHAFEPQLCRLHGGQSRGKAERCGNACDHGG